SHGQEEKSGSCCRSQSRKKNEKSEPAVAKPIAKAAPEPKISRSKKTSSLSTSVVPGAVRASMPTEIWPMLATPVDNAFDDPEWLFEIKWDGYRAVAFVKGGSTRLVSRNQNDLTGQFSELRQLADSLKADTAILDGEVVALDEQGRPSFSLMQQRTG